MHCETHATNAGLPFFEYARYDFDENPGDIARVEPGQNPYGIQVTFAGLTSFEYARQKSFETRLPIARVEPGQSWRETRDRVAGLTFFRKKHVAMKKNLCVDAVLDELREQGIASTVAHGGKHVQVRWLNRLNELRFVSVSRSPSDMRAPQNARHNVRRILREDGMLPEIPKPPSSLRPLPLTRYDQLERDIKELDMRVARVEQLLREQTA